MWYMERWIGHSTREQPEDFSSITVSRTCADTRRTVEPSNLNDDETSGRGFAVTTRGCCTCIRYRLSSSPPAAGSFSDNDIVSAESVSSSPILNFTGQSSVIRRYGRIYVSGNIKSKIVWRPRLSRVYCEFRWHSGVIYFARRSERFGQLPSL